MSFKRFSHGWLAVCLAFVFALAPRAAQAEDKEYLLKAAFIYNFVKFIEWPGDHSVARHSTIDICTIGDGGLEHTDEIFKAASTAKLTLSLVREDNWKNAAGHCHILFIGKAAEDNIPAMLAGLKGQPVLTVSDTDEFAEKGGMIGFVMSNNKIKIEVNTKSIAAAGLRVDAELLEIALKVIEK